MMDTAFVPYETLARRDAEVAEVFGACTLCARPIPQGRDGRTSAEAMTRIVLAKAASWPAATGDAVGRGDVFGVPGAAT